MKNYWSRARIYSLLLVIVILIIWAYRGGRNNKEKYEVTGYTMGDISYQVVYLADEMLISKDEVDSLLDEVNKAFSTYLASSEVSHFNRDVLHRYKSPYFYKLLETSKHVYEKTGGAFDPTVFPLVKAWGFGPDSIKNIPAKKEVDSLLKLVSFDSVFFDKESICKFNRNIKLDFSAVAKGYAVDLVAAMLDQHGIADYMVIIGGEVRCKGKNDKAEVWRIGINDPNSENSDQGIRAISLRDRSVATSGNYRNYYIKDGKKYAHTISPFSGYPVQHNVLSASVFAKSCMVADAYATAFMVLGLKASKKIVAKESDIDVFLIYSNEKGELHTYSSKGVADLIQ